MQLNKSIILLVLATSIGIASTQGVVPPKYDQGSLCRKIGFLNIVSSAMDPIGYINHHTTGLNLSLSNKEYIMGEYDAKFQAQNTLSTKRIDEMLVPLFLSDVFDFRFVGICETKEPSFIADCVESSASTPAEALTIGENIFVDDKYPDFVVTMKTVDNLKKCIAGPNFKPKNIGNFQWDQVVKRIKETTKSHSQDIAALELILATRKAFGRVYYVYKRAAARKMSNPKNQEEEDLSRKEVAQMWGNKSLKSQFLCQRAMIPFQERLRAMLSTFSKTA